jgi:hypothetical protein
MLLASCGTQFESRNSGGFKVSQRIDGSTDSSRCSAGTIVWTFIASERVYCAQKVADG